MWYLFYEIWLFLLIAFLLGWLAHWLVSKATTGQVGDSEPSSTEDQSQPLGFSESPSQIDDLKKISGVGEVLATTLNSLGIYQFAQIAAWTPENIAWIEGSLKFKGRIERENWIAQAKVLAAGQSTEFSERVDQGEIDYQEEL